MAGVCDMTCVWHDGCDMMCVTCLMHMTHLYAGCNTCVWFVTYRQGMGNILYGVATISRLLKIIGLICRILSLL